MASPGRSGQGGLSLQTVVVASLASASAALLTSRLLPPGATIFTAAMTPVIVAVVSDLLHRPARRVHELRTRRTEVMPTPAGVGTGSGEGRWAPLEESLDHLRDEPAPASTNGAGSRRDYGRRRRLHPKWIAVTAGIAFVLAVGALTIPELLFGGALGSDKRTTVFGGGDTPAQKAEPREEAPAEEAPADEAPAEPAPEEAPAQTAPTDPEASPQPTETTPAPTETQPQEEPPAQTPVVPEAP